MEILDVVNENDEVIGKYPREIVHKKKLIHRGIHIFIFNKDGKLMLEKRDGERDLYPNVYGASVSEHVLSGETYEKCARRALKEELGLDNLKLKELTKMFIKIPEETMLVKFYETRIQGNEKLKLNEKSGIVWMDLKTVEDEIEKHREKFAPWFLQLFEWYIKKINYL